MSITNTSSRKYLLFAGLGILVILVIFASVNYAGKLGVGSDFHAFWQAGQDFYQGNNLYQPLEGARAFIYPPFAAFLFQLLALFPLKLSATLFFLFNALILLPIAIYLVRAIGLNMGIEPGKLRLPLILSALASLRFFWDNLHMFQVNFLVFTISLAGLYYYSKRQAHLGVIFLTIASFIKIYPLFLLGFVLLSGAKPIRSWSYALGSSVVCIGLPILFRGIGDWAQYFETFLKLFLEGRVITSLTNHTLKSFVFKAFYPQISSEEILAGCCAFPMWVSNFTLVLLAGLLIAGAFVALKASDRKPLLFTLASLFLFTHLISGITWTAHLVSFLFVLFPLFLIDSNKISSSSEKIFLYILKGIAFFLAIEGSDTVGTFLHNALMQYDIFVVFPLCLMCYYAYILFTQINKRQIF